MIIYGNTQHEPDDTVQLTLIDWLTCLKEAAWDIETSCKGSPARQIAENRYLVSYGVLTRSKRFTSNDLFHIAMDYVHLRRQAVRS